MMGLMSSALSVAKGQYGRVAAGAMLGGIAGGAIGASSRDGSALGGALKGAMTGGALGMAMSSAKAGFAAFHADASRVPVGSLFHGAGPANRAFLGATHSAGKAEFQGLKRLATKSRSLIGNSYSKAVNKIGAMGAAREGRRLLRVSGAQNVQYMPNAISHSRDKLKSLRIGALAAKKGLRNQNGSHWYKGKLYR